MKPAITLSGITKRFGAFTALRDIHLTIEQGEFFALLGPNGAGKTTLISILGGLAYADQGNAKILDYDVTSQYRQARKNIGIVPQELVFDPFFTVRETLQFQSGYFGLKNNQRWIDEILENLGLADKAHVNMRALSGGMKRRVMVAQALVHRPPVLVLDEPTAGVDVELRKTLWEFIQRLNREGHTIVLTTHYLEEAEILCSRIAMLRQGQVIALDSKENLMQTQHHKTVLLRLESTQVIPSSLAHLLETARDGGIALRFNNNEDLEYILHELNHHHCQVRDIEIRRPDLEDVFIATMQRYASSHIESL
jgi:ABC-2 type transport system ATP-binding protein